MKPSAVRRLLRHYKATRRRLPWRRSRNPYRVWVSEVMLQQTQVETVIPFYRRFVRRFPDVRSLARARLQSVLRVWEGLGYYARARNLHRAARQVVEEGLPANAAGWRRLPGVGSYTAAAIASIVSGEAVAVFDGNVRRVAARLVGREAPDLKAFMEKGVPARAPGDFNQAVMELGQTICRPVAPRCAACPLRPDCRWNRSGMKRPVPAPRRIVRGPHHDIAVGVVRRGGRVLIGRRPEEGLLGGLWEFPGGKCRRSESLPASVRREVLEETGVRARVLAPLTVVEHAYSHFSVTLHVFDCRFVSGRARPIGCEEVRWVQPRELKRYPFPAANRKFMAMI